MKFSDPLLMVSLMAVAVGTWWLAHSAHQASTPAAALAAERGYYLKEATFLQTDDQGRVMLTAHTVHAEQLTARDMVQLTHPDIVFSPQAHSQWLITATTGLLPPALGHLNLEGDVRLHALEAKSATGAVVQTEHLRLDMDHSMASTDDPVTIHFAKQQLSGQGLRADLKHDTFQLESKVNGTFIR